MFKVTRNKGYICSLCGKQSVAHLEENHESGESSFSLCYDCVEAAYYVANDEEFTYSG